MVCYSSWRPVTALFTSFLIIITNSADGVSVFPKCVYNCTDVGLPGSYADCDSCANFLVCVGRRTLVMTCPGFLYYDHVIGVCSYHRPIRCRSLHSSQENISAKIANKEWKETESASHLPQAVSVPGESPARLSAVPTLCITNCSDVRLSGRYADCNSCSHMLVCIGTRMTRVRCPPPLHYDPSVGVCNYHWKVNCRNRSPLNDMSRLEDGKSHVGTRHAIRNDGNCINDCIQVKIPGKYASCRSCSDFILCTGDNMFVLSCPKRLQFDSVSKLCTFANSVDCREEPWHDTFLPADDTQNGGKTTPTDSADGKKSSVSFHSKPSHSKHSIEKSSFFQQMGNLLNFASDGSERSSNSVKHPNDGRRLTEEDEDSESSRIREQVVNAGRETEGGSLGDVSNAGTNVTNSLKKLFCETFNSTFNMHLSLCEV